MNPLIKNIFAVEPSQEKKSNFVPKRIQLSFEMAEKKVYKQTDKQDIFVFI